MIKVYVAGKYSANNVVSVLKNIGRGRKAAAKLFALGYAPFCPWHDADFIIQQPDVMLPLTSFYDYCIEWLAVNDVMLVISGADSATGVMNEIKYCSLHNIPVVYSLAELAAWKLEHDLMINLK